MPTCRSLDKGTTGPPAAAAASRATAFAAFGPGALFGGVQGQILAQLTSFSTTDKTQVEGTAGVSTTAGSSVEVQVERALARVLGEGASLPDAQRGSTSVLTAEGLPPEQEVLRRKTSQVVEGLVPMVAELQPMVPNAPAASDVALFKAVIAQELLAVVAEIARPAGPRAALVRVLLGGIVGWANIQPPPAANADLPVLDGLLRTTRPVVETAASEALTASIDSIAQGAQNLILAWNVFVRTQPAAVRPAFALWPAAPNPRPAGLAPPVPSLAVRLNSASAIARGLSEDVAGVTNALDAIGFGFGERHVLRFTLQSDVDQDVTGAAVPRIVTVADILEWAEALAAGTAAMTAVSGQLALNLLADQADELFWLVRAIYAPRAAVPAELLDVQVRRAFVNLARDLDAFAELAISA
jgi:hypothetical protein